MLRVSNEDSTLSLGCDKAVLTSQASRDAHVMAFGVTNLGVVLVFSLPNSEQSQNKTAPMMAEQ